MNVEVPPAPPRSGGLWDSATAVTLFYSAVTVAMTWPLLPNLHRSLPADLGDPVLNCWILAWGADHILRFVSGDLAAFDGFWNANIYHPSPLTLAYSEHLAPQALQIAPVHALTGNILIGYNLIFLSTYVLSALGTYLLVRRITGHAGAAVVAGLFYGFALYRIAQMPHVQTLSSQWMPFALLGFRGWFDSRSWRALAGGTLALVAQNLSCGYYLIFFPPFVAAYCLYEIADRRAWLDVRLHAGLAVAAIVTAAATWPFVAPYLELRSIEFPPRSIDEVRGFSADLLAWVTAAPRSRVWGWLQTFTRGEGELFPGLLAPALALAGLAARARTLLRTSREAPRASRARIVAAAILAIVAAASVAALVLWITGDRRIAAGPFRVSFRSAARPALLAAISAAGVLLLVPRVRRFLRGVPGSPFAFFALMTVTSATLASGPELTLRGEPIAPAPYSWLYEHMPGFDGLRVPARMAMIVALGLAVLGGYGARALAATRAGRMALPLAAGLFLVEATAAPIRLDLPHHPRGVRATPDRMETGDRVPLVYQRLALLPEDTVVVEFPFGFPGWELQYVFYSAVHGKPILNGYSGGAPESYGRSVEIFNALHERPDEAWARLRRLGATHAVVHEQAFLHGGAAEVEAWLRARGAREAGVFGPDRLFALPPP